jgi:hypothetical protein
MFIAVLNFSQIGGFLKIKKIVNSSKMKKIQWKWIFTGSKTCCTTLRPFRFAMAAILNPK